MYQALVIFSSLTEKYKQFISLTRITWASVRTLHIMAMCSILFTEYYPFQEIPHFQRVQVHLLRKQKEIQAYFNGANCYVVLRGCVQTYYIKFIYRKCFMST